LEFVAVDDGVSYKSSHNCVCCTEAEIRRNTATCLNFGVRCFSWDCLAEYSVKQANMFVCEGHSLDPVGCLFKY